MPKAFSIDDIDPDIADLLPAYVQSQRSNLSVLDQAFKHKDYSTIEHLSHNMKGVASSYGLKGLSELGALLEDATKEKKYSHINDLLGQINTYLNSIML